MPSEESKNSPGAGPDPGFLAAQQTREATPRLPWILAAGVVIVGLGILVAVGGHSHPAAPAGGAGLAPADPYAANLPISGLQLSDATSFSGAKVTYVDGQITNTGDRTLTAITVQVGFPSDLGHFAERIVLPLTFIRTREPYVDTEPVSAAPLQPGQSRDFRLIFDTVSVDWNLQPPEIRVISVRSR